AVRLGLGPCGAARGRIVARDGAGLRHAGGLERGCLTLAGFQATHPQLRIMHIMSSQGWLAPPRPSRKALVITDTELRLMASAASIGLSSRPNVGYRTPAATGTPMALYRNAKPRFWRMLRTVSAEIRRAVPMRPRSPFTRVTWALDMATSVPVPMAMPTSAAASAGASLMPSPAMATCRP